MTSAGAVGNPEVARDAEAPRCFAHDLPDSLFSSDALDEQALRLDSGGACFVPARWAHWLDHPYDVASVTFDVGFYTRNDLRARKVYDVNWLLRKAHLSPGGPGVRSDRLKCLAFDGISTVTRRGLQYRGHV